MAKLNNTAKWALNYSGTAWYEGDKFFDRSNININAEDMVFYFTDKSGDNTSYNSDKAFRYPKIYVKSSKGVGKPILCKDSSFYGGTCDNATANRTLKTTFDDTNKTATLDCGSTCKAAMQCPIKIGSNYRPGADDFSTTVSASKTLYDNRDKTIFMFNVDNVGSSRKLTTTAGNDVTITKDNIAHLTYLFTGCYDARAGNNRGNKDNII